MPDLLLELFSEEIPARMQVQAAKDLERLVVGALSDRGLLFDGARSFSGPRRLTLAVHGLPAKQADLTEEKKGPLPSGAPARLAGAPAEETGLIEALEAAAPAVNAALAGEDFAAAMRALSALRAPVDAFFDKVLVNADDAAERDNRLRLLIQVRDAMGRVADFSQISG